MVGNSDIARMLSVLSSNLTAEVETHKAKFWDNEDSIRLYECLQTAICKTQHQFCGQNDSNYLPEPQINTSTILKK